MRTSSPGRRLRDAGAALLLLSTLAACSMYERELVRADSDTHSDGYAANARDGESTTESLSPRATRLSPPNETPATLETAQHLATSAELRPRAPELLARTDGRTLAPLPLDAIRVAAVLGATRGRVLLEATFANPTNLTLEGTFVSRLPEGASPAALGMFLGQGPEGSVASEKLLPPLLAPTNLLWTAPRPSPGDLELARSEWGELRPARVVAEPTAIRAFEHLPRIYPTHDPALVEWSVGNTYRTRIYPIAPHSRKRVLFVYDQRPSELDGRTLLALPVPRPLPPAFRLEVAAETGAFQHATLVGATGETALDGRGAFATGTWEKAALPGDGSFLLAAEPTDRRVRAGLASDHEKLGTCVHARLAPDVKAKGDARTGSAVFVLDTSLSQRDALAASCGRLLREILERDASIDRFQVVTFDVAARPLFAGWRKNTPEERARTLAAVEALWLEGATNMEAALSCLDKVVPANEDATFFLLSDGQLTWGQGDPRELERAHPRLFEARWIGYQLGSSAVNRRLLDRLCRHGRVVTVLGDADLPLAAVAHRREGARLLGVRVEGVDAKDVVVAGAPGTLFPGEPLEVGFRVTEGDPRRARLVVETDQGREDFALARAIDADPLAARAWAELTAARLLDLEDRDADAVVAGLSQEFGLVNRVASLLLLESDQDYVAAAIKPTELDVDAIALAAQVRTARRPAGEPDDAELESGTRELLAKLSPARTSPWPAIAKATQKSFGATRWGDRLDPPAVYHEAEHRFDAGAPDEALRILSSLVEENPRDAATLRLAGFTLMSWNRFEEAADLLGRTRSIRPFEPQAWVEEALALEALGRAGAAALRYEIVLQGRFDQRYDAFAKTAATRLYARLLDRLARQPGAAGAAARERREQLGALPGGAVAKYEAYLFWNLDDTDVDLHVTEPGAEGEEVFFNHAHSDTGGALLGDDTIGLGPEVYVNPRVLPAEISVNYFGTRSASGQVPAATLVVLFAGDHAIARAALIPGVEEKCVVLRREAE